MSCVVNSQCVFWRTGILWRRALQYPRLARCPALFLTPAKSDHSANDTRNPTENIEQLHGDKEIHDGMVRVNQEHAEHDLYKSEHWAYDVENDL